MADRVPDDVLGLEGDLRRVVAVRLGLIGCGAHAYRNTLPPLAHIPEAVLVSFCDLDADKASRYAAAFGSGASWYTDVDEMLDHEDLDAVLVVVGFDDRTGVPRYPDVVEPILRRGIPVWMEKPPAADAAGVDRLVEAAAAGATFAQVGFKKVFSPAVGRLRDLCALDSFGPPTQYTYRYDVDLPAEVGNLASPSGRRFLDDFVHVASVLDDLFGPPSLVQAVRSPDGAGLVLGQYASGLIGVVALSSDGSGLSPIERFEVIGRGANAVLENGAVLRYYPPGDRGPYGTSTTYLPAIDPDHPADFGPVVWEPEFSLGNLHGGSHFVQGYYHQMVEFVGRVRSGAPPARAGLDAARRVMAHLDALVGPFGEWRPVAGAAAPTYVHEVDAPQSFACPATGRPLVLKDGWNYVCRECGQTRSGQASDQELVCGRPDTHTGLGG